MSARTAGWCALGLAIGGFTMGAHVFALPMAVLAIVLFLVSPDDRRLDARRRNPQVKRHDRWN